MKTYGGNPHFSQILKNRRASAMMFSIQPSSWMPGIIMNIEFHPIIYKPLTSSWAFWSENFKWRMKHICKEVVALCPKFSFISRSKLFLLLLPGTYMCNTLALKSLSAFVHLYFTSNKTQEEVKNSCNTHITEHLISWLVTYKLRDSDLEYNTHCLLKLPLLG